MSAAGLPSSAADAARAALAQAGGVVTGVDVFDAPCAIDLHVGGLAQPDARAALEALPFEVVVQAADAVRRRTLLVADMDSTMIQCECIDELADYAGIKPAIAAITERAMQGELDFAAALKERVALLKGLEAGVIGRCLKERVRLMPGARTLVRTMKAHGGRAVLISGGFTAFTGPVAAMIGFDRHVANGLEVHDGRLTGTVAQPIVDSETKRATLLAEAGDALAASLAVGDGANDIPMLRAAGYGVAYHAKPKAAAAADAAVRFGDLTVLLWAQGYPRAAWVQG
ncbi:phosphoserine phosphatase SerB [Sandaracinobacteroides saxicola]|uniref:Phosphoserine phosphatase n=2 Tax=Sandaracinobacteroides saxicola TaxID=2759707 RepID=A0A7G5IM63_9SPHN|nr:phosphoserine phosphatase SerB [Sandaracinobacteroides saxicola]